MVSALILASHMLGRRRTIIKLDYLHFMPDIRQWIKITIDIYIYCPTLWDKKIEKRSELKNENGRMSIGSLCLLGHFWCPLWLIKRGSQFFFGTLCIFIWACSVLAGCVVYQILHSSLYTVQNMKEIIHIFHSFFGLFPSYSEKCTLISCHIY